MLAYPSLYDYLFICLFSCLSVCLLVTICTCHIVHNNTYLEMVARAWYNVYFVYVHKFLLIGTHTHPLFLTHTHTHKYVTPRAQIRCTLSFTRN